jgi:hypothetical protein
MLLLASQTAVGATVILKNGSFVEGTIVLKLDTTLRMETRFGTRVYKLRDVEQIIQSDGESGVADAKKFDELPLAVRAMLNAETDYRLGAYESALSRLEPFKDYSENPVIRSRIDWLMIEANERLARWDVARELLTAKKEKGTPRDQERAKAHFSIFEDNPQYDLRTIGKKQARVFLNDEKLIFRGKDPNSLKDESVMRAALEEYCQQLLIDNTDSVRAFKKSLSSRDIYDACKKLPPAGDVDRHMPYFKALEAAETAILKVESILGDYADAFKVDLIREELTELGRVYNRLEDEVLAVSPAGFVPPFDPLTGRLTAQGGEEWRRRTDLFLAQVKPVVRLLDYMKDKTELFPNELRDLSKALTGTNERMQQMITVTKKNRGREHV